jgi:hypothetical protein
MLQGQANDLADPQEGDEVFFTGNGHKLSPEGYHNKLGYTIS